MNEMSAESENEGLFLLSLKDKGCRRVHNLDKAFEDAIDEEVN